MPQRISRIINNVAHVRDLENGQTVEEGIQEIAFGVQEKLRKKREAKYGDSMKVNAVGEEIKAASESGNTHYQYVIVRKGPWYDVYGPDGTRINAKGLRKTAAENMAAELNKTSFAEPEPETPVIKSESDEYESTE